MAEESVRTFKAEGLTRREWNIVEDARREAERQQGTSLSNKELLISLCNDTRWRK